MHIDEIKEQNEALRRDSAAVWQLLDAAGVPERGAHNSIRVARLIAAASDLLAACEEAAEYTLPQHTRDRLRAAIAKARGD